MASDGEVDMEMAKLSAEVYEVTPSPLFKPIISLSCNVLPPSLNCLAKLLVNMLRRLSHLEVLQLITCPRFNL